MIDSAPPGEDALPPDNAPEVSTRATSTLLLYFERRYGAERLVDLWRRKGFSLDLDYMRTPTKFVSLRFLERVAVALLEESGDARFMRDAGLFTASPQALGFVYYMLRAFGSPRICYRQTVEFSPSYNRVGTFHVERLEQERLDLSYRSSTPEQSRNICELRMGQFASFPTIWGLPPAEVRESECQVLGGSVCRYHLTWKDPVTRWGYLLGLWLGAVAGLGASALDWGNPFFCVASLAAAGFAGGAWLDGRREVRRKDEALTAQTQATKGSLRELQERYDEIYRTKLALEDRVAERTRELSETNVKLEASLAKQQELDRLKSEFFDNVSHELRTPLTLILLTVESLQKRHEDAVAVRQHLATVDRSAQRLLRLINNLLDLAQLESGRARLRYHPLELHGFLGSVLAPFQAMADRQGLWLRLEGAEVSSVQVDPERIDIVFQNLLSNALKFTQQGGVTVRVREDATDVHVEVADTGPGISARDLLVIFDRFAQADNSGTRRFGGTGIGLALVKETLELHSGGISVTSELGKGSTFHVRLPKGTAHIREELRERRQAEMPVRRERRVSGSFPTVEPSGSTEAAGGLATTAKDHAGPSEGVHRVLVVEDDREIRSFVSRLLAEHYTVLEATNGEEGRQRALADRPDLIVSDVMMPVLSGLQMLAALRADSRTVDIPVILLTARQEVSAKVEGLGTGANDYLGKPFSPRELLARIETQLRLREAALRAAENERLAAIGLLTSGFAHEVRNPLNGLMNALMPLKETLMAGPEGMETSKAMLEVMEECGQRIRHLAESLLSFVRTSDVPVPVPLDVSLDSTLSVLAWRVPTDVTMERAYQCAGPVLGDPGSLNQVWLNLLDNALRAVGDKGRVQVATSRQGDEAVVTISDDGVGIRPEDMERLFHPFFSTRAAGEGTGLGLALSRRIVMRHGGRIVLTSEPGKGTQVEVRLPMRPPGVTAPGGQGEPSPRARAR